MLVIDGYGSHQSAKFKAFYKEKNIITIYLPPYSTSSNRSTLGVLAS